MYVELELSIIVFSVAIAAKYAGKPRGYMGTP